MQNTTDAGNTTRVSTTIVIAILHVVFWLGLFIAYYISFSNFMEQANSIRRAFFLTTLLCTVFYINTQFLINQLLEKKKYLKYCIGVLSLVIISVWIKLGIDIELIVTRLPFSVTKPWILAFLPILFCLIFSTLVQMLVNRYIREKKHITQIKELSLAQTAFLKHQINPHFLFNNLNNIYSLVVTNSPHAPELILKLSGMLRYVIYKSSESKVSLKDEIEQIKNLIDLHQLKEEQAANIKLNTTGLQLEAMIEPMILIPLVENCFKHWDYAINPQAHIYIEINTTEELFCFTTENSISEKTSSTRQADGGIGLENITQRLKLSYGAQASFTTTKANGLFKTKLQIKWNSK